MMVRIPALLVALTIGLLADAAVFVAARLLDLPDLPVAALPLGAGIAGFIAGRWAQRTPQVPGFAVGMLLVAVRIGLALGLGLSLLAFAHPTLATLEVIAAITGGLLGTILARRAVREAEPKPEYTAL